MGKTLNSESGVNKKHFTLTLSGILLLSVAAFVFISVPNEGVPQAFRFALITAFAGFALAIGLYHLFLYLFAAKERYFLLYAVFCLPVIVRFAAMEGGIADVIAPVSALPALHYAAEVSLLLLNAIGVWFTHELLKLRLGGWLTRAAYIVTIGLPLIMTAVTGQTVGTWWFPLCGIPYIFITVKAFADKHCRANPYVVSYICVMIYNLLLPVLLLLPPFRPLFAPLVPSMLMQMLVQSALISHSYGESKRREQRLAAEKERIGTELNVATQIQESMLPSIFPAFPECAEFDLYASMQPAKAVGGDFYDFFLIDENTLAVVMADVSGKGVPAALFMVITKTLIKNTALSGKSPEEVFGIVNKMLCEHNDAGMFVTAILGYLDIPTGRFTFVNAGHNPPLLRSGEHFAWLKVRAGFVLAGDEDTFYKQHEITLNPGDELFLYTDGVTEAVNPKNELFSDLRLLTTANNYLDLPLQEFTVSIKREIDTFADGAEQADDITMLALRYKGLNEEVVTNELVIDAKIENMDAVQDFISAHMKECPMKIQNQIAIAVDEIFSNIARYAYHPNVGSATVRITVGDDVTIEFEDSGIAYDPLSSDDPDIAMPVEKREIGGLGLFMVKKLMDSVKYRREGNKNILTIQKSLAK